MEKAITIGVAGHTNHGKTSLVQCLAGAAESLPSRETRRHVTTRCCPAPMETDGNCSIALMDVPGHRQFLKNTIRGLCSVDMVILVVAADDGVMPQTREHLQLIQQLGIRRGFVVLSKADLVDQELLELAELEIREATENTILKGMPVVPFSAVERRGIATVRSCIEDTAQTVIPKSSRTPFRLWIDRISSFKGVGTIACGTIVSGSVAVDEPLLLLPGWKETKARSIEVHKIGVDAAFAGQRAGINLPRVPLAAVTAGMLLAAPGSVVMSRFVNVTLQATQSIRNRMRVKLFAGTCTATAVVLLMEGDEVRPGEAALAQLRFEKDIALSSGDRFVALHMNVLTVVGGGMVLEMSHQKYRPAKSAEIVPYLVAMRSGDPVGIVCAYMEKNRMRFVGEEEMTASTGLLPEKIASCVQQLLKRGEVLKVQGGGLCLKRYRDQIADCIVDTCEEISRRNPLKPFANKEEIRNRLQLPAQEKLFACALDVLQQAGRIERHAHLYTLPGYVCTLKRDQKQLADLLLSHAESIGCSPFTAGGFCRQTRKRFKKEEVLPVLDHLCREGQLIRLAEETVISPLAIETVKERIAKAAETKTAIHLSDSKEILGYGRTKGAVVFEYLDDIGFTLRQGDSRTVNSQMHHEIH